jgi:hypothetical protein
VYPIENVTGPVGMTVVDVIFAVKVTGWPCFEGFKDEVRLAVVLV